MTTKTERPQLELPGGANKLLLHSCCAPCSGEVMEAIQDQVSNTPYSSTIRIFIRRRNISFVRRRTFVLLRNTAYPLLTLTTTLITGLSELRGWNGSQSAVSAAQCASICVSNGPPSTPLKMGLVLSVVRWESQDGRTCSKSMIVGKELLRTIREWFTGTTTGANKVAPRA